VACRGRCRGFQFIFEAADFQSRAKALGYASAGDDLVADQPQLEKGEEGWTDDEAGQRVITKGDFLTHGMHGIRMQANVADCNMHAFAATCWSDYELTQL
jgi:hypothetical protein